MITHALSTLAVLKAASDEGKDFIDSFLPLVADSIRRLPNDVIELPSLQGRVERDFGLVVPQGALRSMLRRLLEKGVVSRHEAAY